MIIVHSRLSPPARPPPLLHRVRLARLQYSHGSWEQEGSMAALIYALHEGALLQ